ncbi:peptide methionine sulfoxide reductase [Athalia rosae]|uniref:peptide methionine sulfoxide reductase n=1 Tax=Athalia rosae TaxID=37344 RepID=UPI00203413F5|nr:peptide methionine sulfoxide reductase [Athalia rosae]
MKNVFGVISVWQHFKNNLSIFRSKSEQRFFRTTMPGQVEHPKLKRATFGMGCFWAGDALFGATPGVVRTAVGYSGGTQESPSYRNLGDHTEVIDLDYNPEIIGYQELLNLFWNNHEYGLTTRIKRQYMSLILWHDEDQKITAEQSREKEQSQRGGSFVTELTKFERFYPAEDYHQKYRLRAHPWLLDKLRLKSNEDILNTTLAAKLNGYLAGAVSPSEFERELPALGISEEAAEYVRKYVIENQGSGLYC